MNNNIYAMVEVSSTKKLQTNQ